MSGTAVNLILAASEPSSGLIKLAVAVELPPFFVSLTVAALTP